MSAEDEGKTEDPTAKRLTEAREQGNVPKSTDLSSAVVILAASGVLWLFGAKTGDKLGEIMREGFGLISTFKAEPSNFVTLLRDIFVKVFWVITPLLGTLAVISIFAQLYQTGFNFTTKPLEPNFKQVFSLSGLKRMVNKNAWVEMLKSIGKMILVGLVGYHVVSRHYFEYLRSSDQGLRQILTLISRVTLEVLWKCGLLLIIIGIIDFWWQHKQWKDKLKMTKQEVKDEMKSSEGDPHIKGKIKKLRFEMHRNMMMHEIPNATVVITNPTFLAIALRYEQGVDSAPTVVAKGKRLNAERIRDSAKANQIPIVEDKPLARSLYEVAEVGSPIPQEFFAAVAEILAYVFGLKPQGTSS